MNAKITKKTKRKPRRKLGYFEKLEKAYDRKRLANTVSLVDKATGLCVESGRVILKGGYPRAVLFNYELDKGEVKRVRDWLSSLIDP